MDETPKGWYVQYIDRDPETIRRQEELARKKKHDLDDEERSAKFIEEQVRRGKDGKEEEVSAGRGGRPLAEERGSHSAAFYSEGDAGLHGAKTGERGGER